MKKVILSIGNMSCSACSSGLEKYLNKQKGVVSAYVNLVLAQASIEYDDTLTIDDLNRFVKEAGFESYGVYDPKKETKKKDSKKVLIIFGLLSLLILYISMSHMVGLKTISYLDMKDYPINYSLCLLILTIPFLIYGKDIIKNGFKNLIHKTPNMDTLVTIGVLSSLLYSVLSTIMIILGNNNYVENLYYESVCIVIFFIKIGKYVDQKSKNKTKEALQELVTITPEKALLKTEDKLTKVTIDQIKKDDILVCKPGMKIAVDGKVISGKSHLDEAFITGESYPKKKEVGDKVIAGSLNIDGYIEYKAEKIGKDSTISEVVRLVVEASNTKSPIAKIADKVSGIFVPTIIIIALLTLIAYIFVSKDISIALTHFITVLVVACPCALGLSTPLAIIISEGLCAKNGIIVKTSETLENAHKIDTIVFDKTGTLTYGNLSISKLYNYSELSDDDILRLTASLEAKSTHPIATAFQDIKTKKNVDDFKIIEGIGLEGKVDKNKYYLGNSKILNKLKIENEYQKDENKLKESENSIIYVIENNKVLALIGVKDIIRPSAKETIKELKRLDKEVIMLTGDNKETATKIAKELGIDNIISNVMPKEKTDEIKKLLNNNKKVMMIGDGINDAPSLKTASIGVSISSGTDIATNSADIILMNNNLISLLNLLKISKKTILNIKENLFWAFFYNICMIPVAIGFLSTKGIVMNPMIAAFAMTASSLTVTINALRLKKIKLRRIENV